MNKVGFKVLEGDEKTDNNLSIMICLVLKFVSLKYFQQHIIIKI